SLLHSKLDCFTGYKNPLPDCGAPACAWRRQPSTRVNKGVLRMAIHQRDDTLLQRGKALLCHWRWILFGGCACAVGALVVSLLLPRVYRATTFLLISESKIGASGRDTNLQQMAMLPTFIPFVDNDALIDEVLKKLKLDRPPYNLTVDLFR